MRSLRQKGVPGYGLDGFRKLLNDAGFENVQFYAMLPSFRYPKQLLPLGEPTVCDQEEFRMMLAEFYQALGWDPEGVPKAATLEALRLTDVVPLQDLEAMAGGPMWSQEEVKEDA